MRDNYMRIKKMKLPPAEARRCMWLLTRLDAFAIKELYIFNAEQPIIIEDMVELRITARNYWLKETGFIGKFLNATNDLSDSDIQLLKSWENRLISNFIVIAYCSEYAVFYSTADSKFYGVLALGDSFKEILRHKLPLVVRACLLPYDEHIIWDGCVGFIDILLGRDIEDAFIDDYYAAKRKGKIVTRLVS